MTDSDLLAARTEHWALTLTAIASVTGSKDEADFSAKLVDLLRASAAFAQGPDAVWTVDVPGGLHPRSCVLGLVRGEGRRTVVLTGHFDIVETGCYGELEPLALLPHRLGPALIEAIAREPFDARSARAAEDLRSGAFLAGRGLLDMKAGLAAGLAVIELLALDGFEGNLLFIAVPDEEGNSAGARHMSQVLGAIAEDLSLDIEAVINLDATGDEGDGEVGRVVALGSIGKLLPSALVVGRAAHAADSFRGLGAAALAGALAAELEWAPELTERTGDELGAGPTLLGMKDSKTAYDVTMPARVWMYWNVMTHRRSPEDVIDAVCDAARRSSARLMDRLAERAAASGAGVAPGPVDVVRYETLLAETAGANPGAGEALRALAVELSAGDLGLPDQCRLLTERLWELSGRAGPAIVLGFASIPYLPVELRDDRVASRLGAAVAGAAAEIVERFGVGIGTIRYFPGISDVSFFGQADDGQVAAIAANTPQWQGIVAGNSSFGAAGIPSINVGPWGRDYHTRLERMHTPYGFGVLPVLILGIVRRLTDGVAQ
ncbi:MAG: M20/M25/M40 family metallo-hydrolase [Mesorhizobium sp.]|nr:M20/M25/M40 family metallo-hydrolase [Mesorhizobium sp.]